MTITRQKILALPVTVVQNHIQALIDKFKATSIHPGDEIYCLLDHEVAVHVGSELVLEANELGLLDIALDVKSADEQ